jgi:hypothetical protein
LASRCRCGLGENRVEFDPLKNNADRLQAQPHPPKRNSAVLIPTMLIRSRFLLARWRFAVQASSSRSRRTHSRAGRSHEHKA